MTACVLRFAVPPERLEHDVSRYMEPEIGPTWPQEAHDVVLNDLKPELQNQKNTQPVMDQLESRGFAVFKNNSTTLGALQTHTEWNDAYLEETARMLKEELCADEVFIWNSVTRSANPEVNTPYGLNHFQDKAIKGLQFGSTVRPVSSGVHVDQDAPNSRRMCRAAAGDDVFEKFSRVQQLNVWRPLKGPVTCKPLAVCDGSTLPDKSRHTHMGMFGTRVVVHYDDTQKWYYIKQQDVDEPIILKIYDSKVLPGQADYAPHSGVEDLKGADGPEATRESIEIRAVVCYK